MLRRQAGGTSDSRKRSDNGVEGRAGQRAEAAGTERRSLSKSPKRTAPASAAAARGGALHLAALLLVVFGLQAAGLFLFKEGYLVTRLVLTTTGQCPASPPWLDAAVATGSAGASAGSDATGSTPASRSAEAASSAACWPRARFSKLLFVLIDAMRFDFMSYNASVPMDQTPHYINKMPRLDKRLRTRPAHALLFRGLADAPTTTLQRLMALTTGSLPTLVDAGSNFGGKAIGEDNLIAHMQRRGRSVVAVGDDTWEGLFPALNASYAYPSFVVWDLHSVDRAVMSHLFPILEHGAAQRQQQRAGGSVNTDGGVAPSGNSTLDWSMLIAHFLGVDHAGHRYGPDHPAMGDKLAELDAVVDRALDLIDDDTLVVVLGDHGMDVKGDHGGDSDNELDAGLFLYSKTRPLTDAVGGRDPTIGGSDDDGLSSAVDDEDLAAVFRRKVIAGIDALGIDGASHPFGLWEGHRTATQIDLVPTLSMLMGLPTPFGSLGTIIPELFFVQSEYAPGDIPGDSTSRSKRADVADASGKPQASASVSAAPAAAESPDAGGRQKPGRRAALSALASWLWPKIAIGEAGRPVRMASPLETLVGAMRANAAQIHTYVAEYSKRRGDAAAAFAGTQKLFDAAEAAFQRLAVGGVRIGKGRPGKSDGAASGGVDSNDGSFDEAHADAEPDESSSVDELVDVYLQYMRYTRTTLVMARKIWARFDTVLIVMGCTVIVLGIGAAVGVWLAATRADGPLPSLGMLAASFAGGSLVGLPGVVRRVAYPDEDPVTLIMKTHHEMVFFGAVAVLVAMVVSVVRAARRTTTKKTEAAPACIAWSGTTGVVLFALYVCCAGSDSFTIYEDHVVHHFVQAYAVVTALRAMMQVADTRLRRGIVARMAGVFVLARGVHASSICRGDQGYCTPSFNASGESSVTAPHAVVMLGAAITAAVWLFVGVLRRRARLAGLARDVGLTVLPVGLFLSFVYWLLNTVEEHDPAMPEDLANVKYVVARLFWLLMIPGAAGYVLRNPACVDVPRAPLLERVLAAASRLAGRAPAGSAGLGATPAESYLCLVAIVYANLAVFQKPMGGVIMALAFMQMLLVLETMDLLVAAARDELARGRLKTDADGATETAGGGDRDGADLGGVDLTGVQVLHTAVLLLIGQKAFFGTGHQNALSSVQYETGFVGLTDVDWVLSPTFVGLNTFGGPMLAGVAAPLVALWLLGGARSSSASASSSAPSSVAGGSGDRGGTRAAATSLLLYFGCVSATEMVSATAFSAWFQKHSQSWRVWGPKFLFYDIGHVAAFAAAAVVLAVAAVLEQ
ncbi:mannose-ethanolamine phosphotransferase gpi13 [Polyrhizophydium stewartii]|uniref:Mannose-ethanolamine phosphotransferase gpi13 n=1 Tax=Polyrhizophydium stewartii TaxID=2732419 RepID=A0ABR4N2A6_9FUNG